MAWCKSGSRTRDPGPPSKFKSGTPGPPSKFKSRTPGPPSKFKSGTLIIIFLHCLTYFILDKYIHIIWKKFSTNSRYSKLYSFFWAEALFNFTSYNKNLTELPLRVSRKWWSSFSMLTTLRVLSKRWSPFSVLKTLR